MGEMSHTLKAIDFFCGVGGMTYGLSQIGIKVLAGIDIDPICKKTYETNNPGSLYIQIDIHNLSRKKLSELTGIKRNDDSLIFIACSPCQYWTSMNTDRTKSRKSKDLLKVFKRFVSWYKPGYIIIENVPGFYKNVNKNALGDFLKFLDNFAERSYTYDYKIVNTSLYGVPQNRKRFILIASRVTDEIKIPDGKADKNLTVRHFIGKHNGFPEISDGHKDNSLFIHTTASLSEKNRKRIRMTPKDGGTRSSWKNDPDLQLNAYRGKYDNYFPDIYGRMYWDKPSPTITTKFYSLTNGRFGHPEEHRAISIREGAVLQSFPKTYIFKGPSLSSIARMIGNAVPPELAKRIGLEIMEKSNAIVSNKS